MASVEAQPAPEANFTVLLEAIGNLEKLILSSDVPTTDDGRNLQDMCMKKMEKLKSIADPSKLATTLRLYIEATLDFTYIGEIELVAESFPEEGLVPRMERGQTMLGDLLELAERVMGSPEKVKAAMDAEVVECIHWRKGALYYMYCAQIQEDKERIQRERTFYTQALVSGIASLQRMLAVRNKQDGEMVGAEDVKQLLREGVYSDTHLLAMMYGGELCYWLWEGRQAGRLDPEPRGDNPVAVGRQLLSTYSTVVQRLLADKGWNCQRALEILQLLPAQ